jgi:hypothetical protein
VPAGPKLHGRRARGGAQATYDLDFQHNESLKEHVRLCFKRNQSHLSESQSGWAGVAMSTASFARQPTWLSNKNSFCAMGSDECGCVTKNNVMTCHDIEASSWIRSL